MILLVIVRPAKRKGPHGQGKHLATVPLELLILVGRDQHGSLGAGGLPRVMRSMLAVSSRWISAPSTTRPAATSALARSRASIHSCRDGRVSSIR